MEEKKLTDDVVIKALLLASEGFSNLYNGNLYKDALDLIHRLQNGIKEYETLFDISNERKYRKMFNEEWKKEYQKELDKQGEGVIAGFPDFDLVYKLYFDQKAEIERLKKDVHDMSWIIKIHKYCVGANHCQNRSDGEFELQKQVDELKEENGKLVTIGNGFALERNNLREELDELKKSGNGVILTSLYKKQADDHKRGLSVQRAYWEKKLQQAIKDTSREICKELFEKQTEVYNNYVFKNEDYDDLETNAIINFSDSLSYAFEKYFKEKYGVEVE